ncbi:alkanesulfonate monooxygenase SsuD/methylene tetrahydromethanopterin reductase-like flavin-dependent oxidoreductase (luciferase family) [Microbacterium saperdae]|uniref:Alkanesulfonate monooxygenase SsuD/methylene tetrahydromethanopterin reductase-like flavin-dependent oxidoreductase (Luciferase family) n=2 Tax=Microbacterium saperdae TaxID=69368 RepID=A0A543BLB7_9MICO|nr:alkanesulfonate monooxygenase SsuD/methylene tetrahydromethanopterin reductase-like flavin-dependent oxidoreductase (luciferase family) [Microbacterium saperdae]
MEIAEAAHTAGLDGLWYCEHVGWHDAVVPTALLLDRYPGLDVGIVGPAPVSRHGAVLAMEFASLAEIAPGRLRAQLGLGGTALMQRIGGGSNSVALVREYVESVRGTLSGQRMSGVWAGHLFEDFQLREPSSVPLDIMAIRPRMLELAARTGDGVSLSTGASIDYIKHAVSKIEKILKEIGRPRDTFRINAQAIGSVDKTLAGAVENAASRLARFSPAVLAILAPGLDPRRDAERMSIAGTPEDLGARLSEYADAGVDEVALDIHHAPGLLAAALGSLTASRDSRTTVL